MTTALWDQLHRQKKHTLVYPSEHVVRFLASLEPGLALDIGCGSARHIRTLGNRGFAAIGVDISQESVADDIATMTDLPYADNMFDVALAYGVFYYGTHTDHTQAISELHRVLKPGGQALVVTRTFRDSRAKGERVDDYTRRMTEGDERGMLINFLEATDVEEDYKMFSGLSYELAETTRNDRKWRDSDWLIRVTK
jgi:SAM-dependent methyltransferase